MNYYEHEHEHEEVAAIDHFDQLPDAILLVIFNKLQDAQSLSMCICVCKRFESIVPQADTISLTIPGPNNHLQNDAAVAESDDDRDSSKSSASNNSRKKLLKSLINRLVVKPLRVLFQIVTKRNSPRCECGDDDEFSFRSSIQVVKKFEEIRSLKIELPAGKIGSNSGDAVLKWKAEFGSKLESCVIVGARSCHSESEYKNLNNSIEESETSSSSSQFSDDELKFRVVWTISCLIAASARHCLLQQVVSEQETLRDLVISDSSKQGRLCMNKQQIEEMRNSIASKSDGSVSDRARVPALRMKMWYAPVLELPGSGRVMKGATLVLIRPADEVKKNGERESCVGDLVAGAFGDGGQEEKAFDEAAAKLMTRKMTYTLEMNSF